MVLMSRLRRWFSNDNDPSKESVLKNLNQILQLMEKDQSYYIATQRVKWLISDVEKNKLVK